MECSEMTRNICRTATLTQYIFILIMVSPCNALLHLHTPHKHYTLPDHNTHVYTTTHTIHLKQ